MVYIYFELVVSQTTSDLRDGRDVESFEHACGLALESGVALLQHVWMGTV